MWGQSYGGVASSFLLECLDQPNCDQLFHKYENPDLVPNEKVVIRFNQQLNYFQIDPQHTLVTKKDQEGDFDTGHIATEEVDDELNQITITYESDNDWETFYITSYVSKVDFSNSKITSRTPKWPSFGPVMHNYELCVFQYDTLKEQTARMACKYIDIWPTSQDADSNDRCDPYCF